MEARQKKIIVPMDFTPASMSAMKVAGNIAAIHGSEVVLLHVVERPAPMAEFFAETDLGEKHRTHANKLMDKIIADWNGPDVPVSKMFEDGKPYKGIVKAVEETMAEMVVMGTWGTHAVEVGTIGSNVNRVIRKTNVPVVTVTSEPPHTQYSKILVSVDPEFGIRELRSLLQRYADSYNPEVELVTVIANDKQLEETESHLKRQVQTLHKQGITNVSYKILKGLVIPELILDHVREGGHDMIWMETHGRNGITNWLLGSVTEEVLSHSNVPVLSLRPERESPVDYYYHSNLPI